MSTWKRLAIESFPEWSTELEPTTTVDLSSMLSPRLVEALRLGGHSAAERIARYASGAWMEGSRNEAMVHLAMNIVRESVQRDSLRTQMWAALPALAFGRLLPITYRALGRNSGTEFEREYQHVLR